MITLPDVSEAPIVFLVGSERDVETLRSWGFVAAAVDNTPWLTNDTEALRDREVILIPDRDDFERYRVLQIVRALLGHAAQILIWEIEDSRAKNITEWFDLGTPNSN